MAEPAMANVPLPRRLDRRMGIGPFPSSREAMKFAAYAAVGTFALPFAGPLAWLPSLSVGFLLAIYRPGGRALDERASDYLRWQLRRRRARRRPSSRGPIAASGEEFVELPGPIVAAVVESGGTPTRFLPPSAARQLFDGYREALRSVGGDLYLDASVVPIDRREFQLPDPGPSGSGDSAARVGYREMVDLLLSRRRRRLVRCVLTEAGHGTDALERLGGRRRTLVEQLSALGVAPVALSGADLRRALRELGWAGRFTP